MKGWDRPKDDPKASWNRPKTKTPAKKDKRRWCRGKVGVPHEIEIVLDSYMGRQCRYWRTGKRVYYETYWEFVYTEKRWWCNHIEQCKNCGKKLRMLTPEECPTRIGPVYEKTEQE